MKNNLTKFEPKNIIIGLAYGDPAIVAAARENPRTALAVIGNSYSDGQTNLPVLARATDEALGMIANPVEARKVLNQNLLPDAQAEMTAAHSDRLSVILQIADPQVVIAALETDVGFGRVSAAEVCFLLMAWATNLKVRPDWEDFLEMEIGNTSLRDLLIAGLFMEVEDVDDISPDMWTGLGLDPDADRERLMFLLEEDELPNFGQLEVATAHARLRERAKQFEDATAGVSHADADDIDI